MYTADNDTQLHVDGYSSNRALYRSLASDLCTSHRVGVKNGQPQCQPRRIVVLDCCFCMASYVLYIVAVVDANLLE